MEPKWVTDKSDNEFYYDQTRAATPGTHLRMCAEMKYMHLTKIPIDMEFFKSYEMNCISGKTIWKFKPHKLSLVVEDVDEGYIYIFGHIWNSIFLIGRFQNENIMEKFIEFANGGKPTFA
jgi:hypothetical protein